MQTEISLLTLKPNELVEGLKKSRLAALLKDSDTLNRMAEAAALLLTNEKLRACDESSILGALYKAATLGFRLEPEFGECYLIPRNVKTKEMRDGKEVEVWKSTCVFQIGYKGWKAVALQGGHISYLAAREVYAEDVFAFEQGTAAFLKHVPANENNGVTTHFYALARLKTGEVIFEVSNKQAAEKSRRNSETQYDWIGSGSTKQKQFSNTPKDIWLKHYAAMAVRVPIKKLCAMLPLTPAIEAATMADGGVTYLQKDGTVTSITPADVEKVAEQIEVVENKIDPALADKYMEVREALGAMDSTGPIGRYYADFKQTELGKSRVFVELFFIRFAQVATMKNELTAFYGLATEWAKDKDLIKILSKRKAEIESNGKATN